MLEIFLIHQKYTFHKNAPKTRSNSNRVHLHDFDLCSDDFSPMDPDSPGPVSKNSLMKQFCRYEPFLLSTVMKQRSTSYA